MSKETKSLIRKSLISGLVLIALSVSVAVAAYIGIINSETATILFPILITGTAVFNTLFLPISLINKSKDENKVKENINAE